MAQSESRHRNAVKFSKELDYSKVDRDDRPYVEKIVQQLYLFEWPIPELEIDFFPVQNHYNMSVKGWQQRISVRKLYHVFLDETQRDSSMDYILEFDLVPEPDNGGRPIILISIQRRQYNATKRRK